MIAITKVDFKCRRCGKCCKYRGDLALTPIDVFKIAEYKEISCEEVVVKYTQPSQRHNFPQILIRGRDPQLTCVFYDKRVGCTIYPVRPAQCYLFPLTYIGEDRYGIQQCTKKEMTTGQGIPVLEWIRKSSSRYESERSIMEWTIQRLERLDNLCWNISKEKLEEIKKILYVEYDLKEDMETQVKNNLEKACFLAKQSF